MMVYVSIQLTGVNRREAIWGLGSCPGTWDEKDDIISSISVYVAKQPSTITLRCGMRNQTGIHRRKPLSVRVGIK